MDDPTKYKIEGVKVGPFPSKLGGRIHPSEDGATQIVLDGSRSMARLLFARELAGGYQDAVAKRQLWRLDESIETPWVIGEQEFRSLAKWSGITHKLRVDSVSLARVQEVYRRETAIFTRDLPVVDSDGLESWVRRLGTVALHDLERVRNTLIESGWLPYLYKFAAASILELATKRDSLIAFFMGAGKTRVALCLAELYRRLEGSDAPTLILAHRKHCRPWVEEFPKLGVLTDRYGEESYEIWLDKKDKIKFDKPFLVLSIDRLVRMSEEEVARVNEYVKNGSVIMDECYTIANKSAKTKSIFEIQGRHHIGLSGTPVPHNVMSILNQLNWIFRGGSSAFPHFSHKRQNSEKKFAAKFVMWVKDENGNRKKVPLLKNPEEFERIISPLMCRRLRNEPDVIAELGEVVMEHHYVPVELEADHLEHYNSILRQFRTWFTRRAENLDKNVPANEILIKLGYLLRSVTQPWKMNLDKKVKEEDDSEHEEDKDEPFIWPEFPKKPTALHKTALKICSEEVVEGYQSVVFTSGRQSTEIMCQALIDTGMSAGFIHGGLSEKRRNALVNDFRSGQFDVLCATYGTMAEGVSLPNARTVVLMESEWSPAKMRQAEARITRGALSWQPKSYILEAVGTCQSYQLAVGRLKQQGMDAALDGRAQTLGGESVPDLQAYAFHLVKTAEDKLELQRKFELDYEYIA